MTAGIKTLELLQRPNTYSYLDQITKQLADGTLDFVRLGVHAVRGGHGFPTRFSAPLRLEMGARQYKKHKNAVALSTERSGPGLIRLQSG